ncbi:translation initiation factor eIF-2B subunit epsilon isoform X2 [Diachasma alloeum]|uniref:translation initiation factor eIF-2B subunit epsilon isoform X2 n=1 Tax=Diachasma alloeum TaxID=454923 RepID=UPI0007381C1C|nr:translation initiation factor eIF-2B subunit epsilon isoform X2 [Diachasma alloeum]
MSKLKGNLGDQKIGKQEVLQALVLADDFGTSLTPMQNVYPSILTPVANAHLLDYLIETLIQSGVQEIFLYCSNFIDHLRNYVSSKNYTDISVSLIISDGCRSLGDGLRDIDTKGIIRGDFILVRGDAFIRADLTSLMDVHRARREKDKGCAISLVLRDLGSTNESLLFKEICLFAADKQKKRVLFYKKPQVEEKKIKFELEWFLEHEQIEINSGFVDSHVYMCSASVLPLFSDNFDFQTMEDFIRGVLMNEEILDSRIYWQALKPHEYALPVTSWLAYHTLSRDILQRQAYPLAPEVLPPLRGIVYSSRSTYKHRSATLARGCILQKDTIVGKNSILGRNTKISRSVIGDSCKIGDNVEIENSYLLGAVTVEDDCKIKDSVLFSESYLHKNVDLDGCIVSRRVKLPPETSYSDVIIQNNNGKVDSKKMSERNEEDEKFIYFKKSLLKNSEDHSDSEDSSSENDSRAESPLPDDTHMFLSEVIDSLLRGYQDKLNCENLILEINSSRYAYNVSIREVTYNVVKAILMLPLYYLSETKTTSNNANYQKTLKVMIGYFNAILLNYIKTEDAQEDCLRAIEDVAGSTDEFLAFAQHLLHLFYDKDILSEEKILDWYRQEADDGDEAINTKLLNIG